MLNNPEKVELYNTIASVIYAQNMASFNFTYDRLNLFQESVDMLQDITYDTCPTFSWYKVWGLSQVSGTFSSSNTVVEYTNYTAEELQALPSLDNLSFAGKKILSIGTVHFAVGAVTDKSVSLSRYNRRICLNTCGVCKYECGSACKRKGRV